jgi:alpha-tubulin suppressor-like RCC1 family protein
MIDYTIHYKNGTASEVSCAGKKDLINTHFNSDETQFKKEVKMISWSTGDMFISENVQQGMCHPVLATADTNPYGWRNEFN